MKTIILKKIIGATVFVFIAFGCNNKKEKHLKYSSDKDKTFLDKNDKAENVVEVKDFEGNKYKIVNVGNQIWTAENLNTSYFNNGEKIPEAKTSEEWAKAAAEGKPAWCYYENNHSNGKKYGKLYNWYVLQDSRGINPKGWHIPSFDELKLMTDEFGGLKTSGLQLKSNTSWNKSYDGQEGNGTNNTGFNGLPGGYRDNNGNFNSSINERGFWWSSTKVTDRKSISGEPIIIIGHEGEEDKFAYPLNLDCSSDYGSCSSPYETGFGFSVRFIKDNSQASYENTNNTKKNIDIREEINSFEGTRLKTGERIIKIKWSKENKVKYKKDIYPDFYRYSSSSIEVPNGKKWILIYLNEDYTDGLVIHSMVPDLFIDNKEYPISGRMFSNQKNINLSRAKDENIKIYSGSIINGVSSYEFTQGKGDALRANESVKYYGEMWFLEIND